MESSKKINERINKIISEKFVTSFMSDTKWKKLIDRLTDEIDSGIFLTYKLIYDETLFQTSFLFADDKSFFQEAIFYKEVEWIEFHRFYEDYVSYDNKKSGSKIYKQDIDLILSIIHDIGFFEIEYFQDSFKLYGYK